MKAIILKNLWLTLADKKGMAVDLALPIILASIFGLIFSGSGDQPKLQLVICDEDGGKETTELIEKFKASGALELEFKPEAETRELVRKGKRDFALVLPKGTSERLADAPFGDPPQLQLLVDPAQEQRAGMIQGIIMQTVMQTIGPRLGDPTSGKSTIERAIKQLDADPDIKPEERARVKLFLEIGLRFFDAMPKGEGPDVGKRMSEPVSLSTEIVGQKKKINAFAHTFPGTAVMFALFAVMASALMLINERHRGTLSRTIISPAGRGAVLAGEAAWVFIWITVQLSVMMAFAILVFKVEILGSWAGLAGVILATAACAAGLGLFIAAYGKTERQVHAYATLIILIMSALGGSMFPTFIMPAWVQRVGDFTITKWAVDGLEDVTIRGADFMSTLPEIGVLSGLAALFLLLGIRAYKWE